MTKTLKNNIITLPNILSFFRLLLIPCFVYTYTARNSSVETAAIILLSGITDICDGFIARKFSMISDLGKILDPVADKLTQLFMMMCLLDRFPAMMLPLIILVFKEFTTGIFSFVVIKKTGLVMSADWHGKACTALLYATMFLHIVWTRIPPAISICLIAICAVLMAVSYILYFARNVRALSYPGKSAD